MYILIEIFIITNLIIDQVITANVCSSGQCKCSTDFTLINCDTKGWRNLDDVDFPVNVVTLTLINNNLKFNTITDLAKIENLSNSINLSINQNPLGTIPPFNHTQLRFLSLQDTSLTSAEFPSSYNNSHLQAISLSNNKIHSINEEDFLILRGSNLKKLHIDSSSISKIDQNAFIPLTQLQALSLKNNQLKSCEFLLSLQALSSIKLDGNQFTSLPQQLTTPRNIKTYSFIHNSISIIDESSPLSRWFTMNYTNVKIFLANNPFNCCLSLWFIRFIKTSPQFVGDASVLTCTSPSIFAGKLLIKLNPDEMNCGSDIPSKSWWTTGRIISIVIGSVSMVIIMIILIIVYTRRYSSHSGYEPIGGNDELYSNLDTASLDEHTSTIPEDDDELLTNASIGSTRSIAPTDAPTHTTAEGVYAADGSLVGGSQIEEAALIQ
ncbi:unnamed protein product [Rotaria sordida]|uniref:LRRCT domain-containing protein n=1 Tax=Rotaria sordida TaxID=392033 RepID=A0A818J6Y3_9BILA|nr:unnamed protein product [Rotaria sordida]CAF3535562.1 unnamed protein product [Rotaria sordida]